MSQSFDNLTFINLQAHVFLANSAVRTLTSTEISPHLIFFQHFYHLLMSMKRPQGGGLKLAREHIAACISEIHHIQKSSDFLRANAQVPEHNIDNTTGSGCQPIGFDASLNCRLSAPTPPRSIKIICWEKVSFLRVTFNARNLIPYYNVSSLSLPGSRIFCETPS